MQINWIKKLYNIFFKKKLYLKDRTKTDTGKWVEDTQAIERTVLKELGKLTL
jgi:hypothetical protein